MSYLIGFFTFWYRFIVGDDWTIAASVAVGIALTFWLVQSGVQAWWLLPAVAVVILGVSLWRSARAG